MKLILFYIYICIHLPRSSRKSTKSSNHLTCHHFHRWVQEEAMQRLAADMNALAASSTGHTGWNWWEVHHGVCTFRRKQKNATDALWPAKPTWPSGLGVVDCCIIKREPGSLDALCIQTHPCEPYGKTCSSYHFFHPPPPVPSRWLHPLVSFLTLRTAF